MNKKISIATLHYGFNEGAVLQAYSTASLFSSILPDFKVEIIDQRYPSKKAVYGKPESARKIALQNAIDSWLPLSEKKFHHPTHDAAVQYINDTSNALVIGSDQVWKLRYQRRLRRFIPNGIFPRQSDPFYPSFPNLYWPSNELQCPRVSFASSIGQLDGNDIPKNHRRQMAAILDDFSMLSVRDEKTFNFMEMLSPSLSQRAEVLPDPTLCNNLITTSNDDALKTCLQEMGVDFSRERIGIVSPDNSAVIEMADHFRKRGSQIIGITTQNSFCDINLFQEGFHPLEWARLFHYMDFCVLDRMHAMIFSLINSTPFVAIDQNLTKVSNETKVLSLLRTFDLLDHYTIKDQINGSRLKDHANAIRLNPWDWKKINTVREKLKQKAANYVSRVGKL